MEKDSTSSGRPPASRRPARPAPLPPPAIFMEPTHLPAEPDTPPADDPPAPPAAGQPVAAAPAPRPAARPARPAEPEFAHTDPPANPSEPAAAPRPRAARPAAAAPAKKATPAKTGTPAQRNSPTKAAAPARTATPAKAPAKKATPAKKAADVEPAPRADEAVAPRQPVDPPQTQGVPATEAPDDLSRLWQRLRTDPEHAAELLALAVVRRLGPGIAAEARWLRATYPHATPSALARYAQQRQLRRAGYGSLFAVAAGVLEPVAALLVQLETQAQLALGTAAAFGRDADHPDRAAELLTLLGLYPTLDEAALAVAAITDHDGADPVPVSDDPDEHLPGLVRLAMVMRGTPLAVLALRRLRGGGAMAGVLLATAGVERVARRATALYRAAD